MSEATYPSVEGLRCPNCGGTDLNIIGTKGATGKAVGIGLMFGAIGNMVMDASSKKDIELKPVRYQCAGCKNKFEEMPLVAPPEELLEQPCTVTLHRLSSPLGMAVTQQVFLNGVKMGNVKNGKDITFQTYTRHNTVFVTDQYGVAFKGSFKFIAESGGTQEITFKRKFL